MIYQVCPMLFAVFECPRIFFLPNNSFPNILRITSLPEKFLPLEKFHPRKFFHTDLRLGQVSFTSQPAACYFILSSLLFRGDVFAMSLDLQSRGCGLYYVHWWNDWWKSFTHMWLRRQAIHTMCYWVKKGIDASSEGKRRPHTFGLVVKAGSGNQLGEKAELA